MTDETTYPELDRLRAAHDEIPAPAPTATDAARARLRAAMAVDDEAASESADVAHPTRSGRTRAWRGRRRPGRRPAALAIAGLAAAAVVVATTGLGGGGVDVVARAEAALSSGGPVVHLVTSGGAVMADGAPVTTRVIGKHGEQATLAPRIESWAVDGPLRFAVQQTAVAPSGTPAGVQRTGLSADGTYWELDASGTGPVPQDHLPRETADDYANRINNGLGVDPTARIRRMLAAGEFRSDGGTTVRGRGARRLVADQVDASGTLAERTEYLVDATTYEPLDVRVYAGPAFAPASTVAAEASQPTTTTASPADARPSPGAEGATTTAMDGATTADRTNSHDVQELSARARALASGGSQDGAPVLLSHVVVERFERLPLDDGTAALFRVPVALERFVERTRRRSGGR